MRSTRTWDISNGEQPDEVDRHYFEAQLGNARKC